MPASRRGVAARRRPRAALASPHRSAAHVPRSVLAASLSSSEFGRGVSCPQVDPHMLASRRIQSRRPPPRPPCFSPHKHRAQTPPPSFSTSARRLAASPHQTLRMPLQPADRSARTTWPACFAKHPTSPSPRRTPAPRQRPVTHSGCRGACTGPGGASSRRSARLGRSSSGVQENAQRYRYERMAPCGAGGVALLRRDHSQSECLERRVLASDIPISV